MDTTKTPGELKDEANELSRQRFELFQEAHQIWFVKKDIHDRQSEQLAEQASALQREVSIDYHRTCFDRGVPTEDALLKKDLAKMFMTLMASTVLDPDPRESARTIRKHAEALAHEYMMLDRSVKPVQD